MYNSALLFFSFHFLTQRLSTSSVLFPLLSYYLMPSLPIHSIENSLSLSTCLTPSNTTVHECHNLFWRYGENIKVYRVCPTPNFQYGLHLGLAIHVWGESSSYNNNFIVTLSPSVISLESGTTFHILDQPGNVFYPKYMNIQLWFYLRASAAQRIQKYTSKDT